MSGCGHTQEEHNAIRDNDESWNALRFIGFQPGGEGWSDYEMRNIPGTECTLTRPCTLTESQRDEARAFAKAKRDALMGAVAALRPRQAVAA